MNIRDLQISAIKRIIAHVIHPKTASVDAYSTHAEELLTFSPAETGILIDRLQEVLSNNKKTFKLDFEDLSEDSLFDKLPRVSTMHDIEFIKYSQNLADDLADSHFRIKIPGGYCLIGEGVTTSDDHFFFILKAEVQEVFTISGSTLQVIKDVFLSPAKDFYKIGFFLKRPSGYIPYMFDDQFSLQKKDLTEYFYGKFLGLTTDKNDSLKSKNFFSDTKEFIETNVSNTKDRIGLLKALTVLYREETSGILSPRSFSENYFEGALKVKYDEVIDSKYPQPFTKDIKLIERRLQLQRLSIPLSYALALVGNSDSLSEVEVIHDPSEETIDNLEPEINSGIIRKLVIIREISEENTA